MLDYTKNSCRSVKKNPKHKNSWTPREKRSKDINMQFTVKEMERANKYMGR